VETEEIYLTKYARMVAESSKHLHMEKPGGTDPKEFKALIDLLKAKNLVFSTGYMYRFNPKIREAIERAKSGELGNIYSVEAHMDCKHPPHVREWLRCFPGGMMFFLGCHLVDMIYQIQGAPLEIIPLNCSTGIDGLDTDDCGLVVFKYRNGVSFAKTCANENGGFLRRQLVICGEKGTIEVQPLEKPIGFSITKAGEDEGRDHRFTIGYDMSISDRYLEQVRDFARIIRGEMENPYPWEYEYLAQLVNLACCGLIEYEKPPKDFVL
jgi:predicted dehydrogenase